MIMLGNTIERAHRSYRELSYFLIETKSYTQMDVMRQETFISLKEREREEKHPPECVILKWNREAAQGKMYFFFTMLPFSIQN